MDVDVAGCATVVKLSSDKKKIEDVRIAFGVMGPFPARAEEAENIIKGKEISREIISEFADNAVKNLTPRTGFRASAEFRNHISHVMAKRTLIEAIEAAGGAIGGE